jgi:glutamate formiminotransferase/formiminotetrahydrofolate cyclodeaminase
MVESGNPNSITDAGVGAAALLCGVYGAYLNVLINIKDLKDRKLAETFRNEADGILAEARRLEASVQAAVLKAIE